MRSIIAALAVGGLLLAVGLVSGGGAAAQTAGIPIDPIPFEPSGMSQATYEVIDYTGDEPVHTTADFRIVNGTGNAAELWLTTTEEGRIYDLGGRYLNFSDDEGVTWQSVQNVEGMINGEGSVAVAPNGDVVGITWDPYSGDRVFAFKYDKAADQWYYQMNPFHTPFWDRPGIDVVPGPFDTPLGEVPYITFINGFPHTEWWYSLDGLNYVVPTSLVADPMRTDEVEAWLDVQPAAHLDWIQSNQYFPFAALGGGNAIHGDLFWSGQDMAWHDFSLPDGAPLTGMTHTDSLGRFHNVRSVGGGTLYRMSDDGGRTWSEALVEGVRPGDFRANAAVGVAAVAAEEGTQDVVLKFDISGDEPVLTHRYDVGLGDDCRCQGVGFYGLNGGHRFDFLSISILPDGRFVSSFMDSTTIMPFPTLGQEVVAPALAVELPAESDED